jgi:hypothetical protein
MTADRRSDRAVGLAFCAILLAAALACGFRSQVHAQVSASPARALIAQAINEANLATLPGNTRPEARNPSNDRGRVDDSLPMPHMQMQVRRAAAQEQALDALIAQLHDPQSPSYHHWLSPSQLGAQFGPASSDVATVTNWLRQYGFTINSIAANGMTIDFSGTAGQVRSAFHTEIHNLSVGGIAHIANISDPQIPAALAPAVVGVVSLNNFHPRPQAVYKPLAAPEFTSGGQYYITPADLETIYNFNPLFTSGNSGQGQTIYLIEDTDLFTTNDWTTFRSEFGLSTYTSGSLTTIHPAGSSSCSDPGVTSDDGEAIIDAEYASAAAPSATIFMATCADNPDGILAAVQNLVGGSNPPAIMSISYGDCEADNGAASNAAYNAAYQTGVAEGWSIYVSAGDEGAGGCDSGEAVVHGIGVSALASTVYNVAVGGTDYSDTYSGTNSTYWSSSNSASNGSALSYIPEIPWNSTCGSQLFATNHGYSTTYGSSGFCNSSVNSQYKENWAGSGGPSACATGSPAVTDVVSGSCQGYAKPSWQLGLVGNPADSVRDLPDVSMFASFGPWNHSYVICYTDTSQQGGVSSCTNPPTSSMGGWAGTSFGAPIWAGIQALINQYVGSVQGNPNPILYNLATAEYGSSGSSSCNSSNGNSAGSPCIFYDVTLGDNDTPCKADGGTRYDCYLPSGKDGVLSTSNSAYAPAYTTQTGWDFATGIGTVNVYNLVHNWASGAGGNAELSVTVSGSGTVTSSPPGISCGSTCSSSFADGTQVTLTANPGSGSIFTGWGGACSGTGSCVVTIDAPESVTATFAQAYTLSVSDTGGGTVTSSPSGISCGSTCGANFASGTQVTLSETPASGYNFSGWNGACSGASSHCVVSMNAAESVTATFTQITYALSVSVSGNGTVTSSPSGISCGSTCSANFASGTQVTLSETPTTGYSFSGWSGACSGTGSCVVMMSAAESATAIFALSGGGGGGGGSMRTWVSGTGTDSGTCTITAPCQTFAYALTQTASYGEVNCAGPGGFGGGATITISNPVTIDCTGVPGVTVPSSGEGIQIEAAPVTLRGLIIDCEKVGYDGVIIQTSAPAAPVYIEDVVIMNCLNDGIVDVRTAAGSSLFIRNSTFRENASVGVSANASGEVFLLENVHSVANGYGVLARSGTNITVSRSVMSGNSTAGVEADSGSQIFVDNTEITQNTTGVVYNGNVVLANSDILYNVTGVSGTGTTTSYGNNRLIGNVTNGTLSLVTSVISNTHGQQ